jgi:hypothetical protein
MRTVLRLLGKRYFIATINTPQFFNRSGMLSITSNLNFKGTNCTKHQLWHINRKQFIVWDRKDFSPKCKLSNMSHQVML